MEAKMNVYSIAGFQAGDGVIAPNKLELTDDELLRAQAQEQSADDPAPEAETLMQRASRLIASTFSAATPLKAKWPEQDAHAPDYRHMSASAIGAATTFNLTPDVIELLIGANRFDPHGKDDVIALAFRGLALGKATEIGTRHEVENATSIEVTDVRPNHSDYRCLLGFYKRDADPTKRRLTLFSGSTVPNPHYMRGYYNKVNFGTPFSTACNMVPTGGYVFRVASHKGGTIKPALRMTDPDDLAQDAKCTVLRTTNDLIFGLDDTWDTSMPFDNVHCTYVTVLKPEWEAAFSSAGCLTVRGKQAASDQWAKFQAVLNQLGQGKRCDVVLLTGRDAGIAAAMLLNGQSGDDAVLRRELVRLRPGSQSAEVARLRVKLGLSSGNYFGPVTKKKLAERQTQQGQPADGIFTPELDTLWGWDVFGALPGA
jgi:hypothetical protein